MCKAGELDLSYESLTSHEARQMLRDLPRTDPSFFAEISQPCSGQTPSLSTSECLQEDSENLFEAPDDSDVPLAEVAAYCEDLAFATALAAPINGDDADYIYLPDEDGGLSCVNDAESVAKECVGGDEAPVIDTSNAVPSRPKRNRRPNVLYSGDIFDSH